MADLKPCPFCGGEAETFERCFLGFSPTHLVRCLDCYSGTDFFKTEDEAIAAWNRRAKEGDDNE